MLHPEAPLAIRMLLAVHIAAGFLALVIVPGVLAVTKGGPIHRRLGLTFVFTMFVVSGSALVLGRYFDNVALMLISVFSTYSTFLGWRAVTRKQKPATTLDWAAALVAFAAGTTWFVFAWLHGVGVAGFGALLYALSTLSMLRAASSMRGFLRPPARPTAWLTTHFSNMLAAYIATVTAFGIVTIHFIHPTWLVWATPVVVGTIAIQRLKIRYASRSPIGARVRA